MPICNKCSSPFPFHVTVNGKVRNFQHRKFCLVCSPFDAHNTRDLLRFNEKEHYCPQCKTNQPIELFYVRKNGQPSPYCKKHTNLETIKRQQDFKKRCVEYKGGRCEKCGYDKCLAALHFHHRNPEDKKSPVSYMRLRTFENAKSEIDKCDLLCANCHAEEHVKVETGV